MSFLYREAIRATAQRLNAISGDTPTGVEASYTSSTFSTTQLDNPAFTPTIVTDGILAAQAVIIKAICETSNHPWRGLYLSATSNLASGAIVPVTDSLGKQIIGGLGDVKDSVDNTGLTEIDDYDTIRRYIRGIAAGDHVNPLYYYSLSDERIFHTRTNVIIGVCTYDHAAELTAIATPSNPVKVPESVGSVLVSGAVAMIAANESPGLAPLAQAHAEYFSSNIALIRQGLTITDKKLDKE